MTQKAINFKLLVPAVSAGAIGIVVSVSIVYLKDRYPVPVNQADPYGVVAASHRSTEIPNADGRLWRIHVLLR
jgi:hypothetical protein